MSRVLGGVVSSVFLLLAGMPGRVQAQIAVLDDLILMASRQEQQSQARKHRHLDPPGGENLLPPSPGADEPRLGEEKHLPRPLPFSRSRHARNRQRRGKESRLQTDASAGPQSEEVSLAGLLEVPAEEGPPGCGLSLDAAIERLVADNPDLAARYQDIPKARAEVLTAGLRNNPLVFVNISNVPYGHFSPEQPASTFYDLTFIQPVDVNGKRRFEVRVAQEAVSVLELQYQDAVRTRIARLHEAFLDVLEVSQAVAALRAGLAHLQEREKAAKGAPAAGLSTVSIARSSAELALSRAEVTLLQARRELALLLGIPGAQAALLQVVGTLHDCGPPLPPMEELIDTALRMRPDLIAHRQGMRLAHADLGREKAEALDDLFLFYTPFNASDYSPLGLQSAAGWGLGILFPVPVFDRNQGEIARARVNVKQTELDLEGIERRVINEVQHAATEYAVSRDAVQQLEREVLPAARLLRDEEDRLFVQGQSSVDSWLEAQKEYSEAVRDYLETLAYHRRTMLRLNSAIGQRLLP